MTTFSRSMLATSQALKDNDPRDILLVECLNCEAEQLPNVQCRRCRFFLVYKGLAPEKGEYAKVKILSYGISGKPQSAPRPIPQSAATAVQNGDCFDETHFLAPMTEELFQRVLSIPSLDDEKYRLTNLLYNSNNSGIPFRVLTSTSDYGSIQETIRHLNRTCKNYDVPVRIGPAPTHRHLNPYPFEAEIQFWAEK